MEEQRDRQHHVFSFGIDTTVPSTARMYDYWLGGHDNFAADRAAALKVSEAAPEAQLMAVENRRFLRRAVRYLAADAGITQFLDIGTGLPTQGNVHQVAQEVNPDARVVYVDNDPMVLAHSRALKTGGNTVVIEADLRDPQVILDHPEYTQAHRFQPAAGCAVGGRAALRQRRRRPARDRRRDPRRASAEQLPSAIACDR